MTLTDLDPHKWDAREGSDSRYILQLFIAGNTPRSTRAIRNLREFLDTHLKGRFDLSIIDIYQQPHLAEAHNVFAAPMLVKQSPAPLRRLIGDMSMDERVSAALSLPRK